MGRICHFFRAFYEEVTETDFELNTIRNLDKSEPFFELEENMYIFIDKTIQSTFHILNLYNHLLKEEKPNSLYSNFISLEAKNTIPLIENNLSSMQEHSGQMGGEYPLSISQREAINHFAHMKDGEILAVNGPPGTGKTTLLQSIVADMYVKSALNEEKPPLIVATSTNNQAVTNIITSFGNIQKVGISNLEERWIEGVNSFATYFPSISKIREANEKGYQYTNQKGEFFVLDIEDKANIEKSATKFIQNCNQYFRIDNEDLDSCRKKLHEELHFFEQIKMTLLELVNEAAQYNLDGKSLDKYLSELDHTIKEKVEAQSLIRQRVSEWQSCYHSIPILFRLLKFMKFFAAKIRTEFRFFMNDEEHGFINENMSFDEIKETYSQKYAELSKSVSELKSKKADLEKIKGHYDHILDQLKSHYIVFYDNEELKYNLEINLINDRIDRKIRYVEFWLAVHYFECRWLGGEDELSDNQKGKNFKNVVEKFYNRLCMLTPCLVMTFYMLPKQFLAYGDQRSFYLYNFIDLLIVDEAGQVSPEIAAGAFSLAKKAVVVGDVYQIESVWSVNRALDKALALSNGVIQDLDDFILLEQTGLNSSCSSVMKVAAKSCSYQKFDERGLFLSEHRRCYDEIIDYCNKLVYRGNLQPLRGKGKQDRKLAIKEWPQMGYSQIDTEHSSRKGSSRLNQLEAKHIVDWLEQNLGKVEQAYPKDPKENLVGIITPFKAQVKCIENELNKRLPVDYSQISVGTVHTFQGAERNIIILSTVYGKQDGCYFIDVNKSLLNVAVSRAKDYFFVFGDIHCLKDTENSASGLLRKCIGTNPI